MGLELNGAQLLIRSHRSGLHFGRMATLGRQGIHAPGWELLALLQKAGFRVSTDRAQALSHSRFAEEFFLQLGASEVIAIDASSYEGAQIVHDMNQPIPAELVASFDLVLDGGTLEHVFDFPTALRNAGRMVKPGGRFLSITIANNFSGHGFYQFSPELFYRFLAEKNGWAMESCIVWEDSPGAKFYQVPDPDSVHSRIELASEYGTYMFVQARKVAEMPRDFIPQQSDYVRSWVAQSSSANGRREGLKTAIRRNPAVWPAIAAVRRLIPRSLNFSERYRVRGIRRNDRGFLKPLDDLRVID